MGSTKAKNFEHRLTYCSFNRQASTEFLVVIVQWKIWRKSSFEGRLCPCLARWKISMLCVVSLKTSSATWRSLSSPSVSTGLLWRRQVRIMAVPSDMGISSMRKLTKHWLPVFHHTESSPITRKITIWFSAVAPGTNRNIFYSWYWWLDSGTLRTGFLRVSNRHKWIICLNVMPFWTYLITVFPPNSNCYDLVLFIPSLADTNIFLHTTFHLLFHLPSVFW